jgi:gluconokinase
MRRRHAPLFRRVRYWLNIKDYIMHRMTGELAAELSLATATQMMDFTRHRWDPYALAIAGARESQFPPIVPGDRVLGRLSPKAAGAMGLPAGLPVVPGVYDGGALTLGIGGLVPNVATVNIGTTTMFRTSVTRPVIDHGPMMRLHTNAFLEGVWVTGAGVNNAGNTVAWFMRTFGIGSYRELEALARGARTDGAPPVMFPYLTGERAPYIGSKATGAFWGLKDHHGPAEMALAMLTGIGYTLKFIQEGVRETGTRVREVRSGGGGAHMDLWLRTLSGIFDLPVRRPVGENPSLVGNALIALVALKRYPDIVTATRMMVKLGSPVRAPRAEAARHAAGFRRFADLLGKVKAGWQ